MRHPTDFDEEIKSIKQKLEDVQNRPKIPVDDDGFGYDIHCLRCKRYLFSAYPNNDPKHEAKLPWCENCKKMDPEGYKKAQEKYLFQTFGGRAARMI